MSNKDYEVIHGWKTLVFLGCFGIFATSFYVIGMLEMPLLHFLKMNAAGILGTSLFFPAVARAMFVSLGGRKCSEDFLFRLGALLFITMLLIAVSVEWMEGVSAIFTLSLDWVSYESLLLTFGVLGMGASISVFAFVPLAAMGGRDYQKKMSAKAAPIPGVQ